MSEAKLLCYVVPEPRTDSSLRSITKPTLLGGELEHRFLVEGLTWLQNCVRKVGMIGRIREMLCLQAESIAPVVYPAVATH